MKRIELDIPEWAQDKHIYILAGRELLAITEAAIKEDGSNDKLSIKNIRCNMCGKCCMNFPSTSWFYKNGYVDKDTNKCIHLKKYGDTYECDLSMMAPFNCLISEKMFKDCCVTYR